MINISPIAGMEPSLKSLVEDRGLIAESFRYYGIIATTKPQHDTETLMHCQDITNSLSKDVVASFPIAPGTWQPGAMRYTIYLMP